MFIKWTSPLSFLAALGGIFHFSLNIMSANRIAPDGMPCFAVSHLGLFCLPMSHKKDARLIWVNAKKSKLVYNTFQQRNPVDFLFHVYVK